MKLDIETNDQEPSQTKPIAPPPDYMSRAVRIRLMMLFALLVAVLVLMKEAGKPERWMWMGFDDVPVSHSSDTNLEENTGDTEVTAQDDMLEENVQVQSVFQQNGASESQSSASSSNENRETEFPIAASEFWAATYQQMKPAQRRILFRFMKRIRTEHSVNDPEKEEYRQLVHLLTRLRSRFHREIFDRLAIMPDGSEEKTKLANDFYESQEVWEQEILPAFDAVLQGEDFSVSQLQEINRLQQILDPLANAVVQDSTAIGWEGDSTAWIRMWERVLQHDIGQPLAATHLQLSGQPKYYRGRAIEIGGWVRSARRKDLTDSELGVSHYYILWVRPVDTNLAPYCIYSLNVPEGFPNLTERFCDLNERITTTGLFFKIRTFVDAVSEINESPVILAENIELNPETIPLAANAWQPSRVTLVTILILIPLLAMVIAWLVYQNSQTRQYQPGAKMTEKIRRTLHELADDPSVQSNEEKIRELYQSDVEEI